jgi:hypothetical protein
MNFNRASLIVLILASHLVHLPLAQALPEDPEGGFFKQMRAVTIQQYLDILASDAPPDEKFKIAQKLTHDPATLEILQGFIKLVSRYISEVRASGAMSGHQRAMLQVTLRSLAEKGSLANVAAFRQAIWAFETINVPLFRDEIVPLINDALTGMSSRVDRPEELALYRKGLDRHLMDRMQQTLGSALREPAQVIPLTKPTQCQNLVSDTPDESK